MYLSRLTLSNERRSVLWRQQVYRVHQRLLLATGDQGRLLFRLHEDARPYLLVQTQSTPDWDAAFGEFDVLARSPEVKQFEPAFGAGQRLAFRLRANPTVKRDGRRQGLYRAKEQTDWLQRKADDNGFAVAGVTVQPQGKVTVRKRGQSPMRFCAVQYDGILSVVDAAAFRSAVESGVGSGKGFGFGLLSVASLSRAEEG